MANNVVDMSYFNIEQLKQDIVTFKDMYDPEILSIDHFISDLFDSNVDKAIEFYEFIDLLLILRTSPRPMNNNNIYSSTRKSRTCPIKRPWTFNTCGKCSMPVSYMAARDLYMGMYWDTNGVITTKELYGFV
jgi:hypothetical protein